MLRPCPPSSTERIDGTERPASLSIFSPGFCYRRRVNLLVLAAGIASMTAALDRGDIDEAARQGALAGPAVVEKALAAKLAPGKTTTAQARTMRLAAIAAAPITEDAAELLPDLAELAAGPDRRTAIPAARAAI